MHYYTFHIGDYASHTRNLSPIEDLAFRRLLDEYYLHERPFNGCLTDVARQVGLREYEAEVGFVLNTYFEPTENGWVNKRADKEIEHFKSKQAKASAAGKASAERRLNVRSTDVQPTNNQQPITNNQLTTQRTSAPVCPQGVSEQVWKDFLAVRKAKRSPITETALLAIDKEAGKAGWSLERALSECVARGWQSFKADWVDKSSNTKLSFAERDELLKRKKYEEMTGRPWPEDNAQPVQATWELLR